jgi:CheY-like chemotaxis protein
MKTALIVDDTDANRLFFERLLLQAGFIVKSASNGTDAHQIITSSEQFDLAILDIEMGGMNGLELTKRIRTSHDETCIVVATMHDERSIMESAFAKGCDIFLVKPHGFIELFKRLTTLANSNLRHGTPIVIDQYGLRQFVAYTA